MVSARLPRGTLNNLRGQTASKQPARTSEVLPGVGGQQIQGWVMWWEGPGPESQQKSILVLRHVPAAARGHPVPCFSSWTMKTDRPFQSLSRGTGQSVPCTSCCSGQGENLNKCAHTLVLASVLGRHPVSSVEK